MRLNSPLLITLLLAAASAAKLPEDRLEAVESAEYSNSDSGVEKAVYPGKSSKKASEYEYDYESKASRKKAPSRDDYDDALPSSDEPERDIDSASKSKFAPVDGKDGRPHEGPFVETDAARDRKSSKNSGDDDEDGYKKPGPGSKSGSGSVDKMPESNDGVMDDPNRVGPKEGTRGTEGGISEKSRGKYGSSSDDYSSKEKDSSDGKVPESPQEAPPLPHSEEKKIVESGIGSEEKKVDEEDTKDTGFTGLSKPEDLPDSPHDIPHPAPGGGTKETSYDSTTPTFSEEDPSGLIQPLHSLMLSFTMILFSEIGDKTFLVAALMAMKHPPLLVFFAAFPALVVMTVGSALLGHAAPALLPVRFTNLAAAALFFIFGAKLMREGFAMDPNEGVGEEMREVEAELEEKEQLARKMGRRRSSLSAYALESGRGGANRKGRSASRLPNPPDSPPSSANSSRSASPASLGDQGLSRFLGGLENLLSLLLSPVWVQTFVMTFLGEWGDRSQIATIAMAAGQDYWWVTTGALCGHAICTAIAVVGGRAIAGRVSMRIVTLGGAFAFLVFGVVYLAESFYYG